jgi:hypothetical protein
MKTQSKKLFNACISAGIAINTVMLIANVVYQNDLVAMMNFCASIMLFLSYQDGDKDG